MSQTLLSHLMNINSAGRDQQNVPVVARVSVIDRFKGSNQRATARCEFDALPSGTPLRTRVVFLFWPTDERNRAGCLAGHRSSSVARSHAVT
jgi:hypothetical protein